MVSKISILVSRIIDKSIENIGIVSRSIGNIDIGIEKYRKKSILVLEISILYREVSI